MCFLESHLSLKGSHYSAIASLLSSKTGGGTTNLCMEWLEEGNGKGA